MTMIPNSTDCSPQTSTGLKNLIIPAPAGSPETVAAWLERIRVGAIFGLAFVICRAMFVSLLLFGVVMNGPWGNTITRLTEIIGCIAVWLIVSQEPLNKRWQWLLRWVLRIASVLMTILCVASIVTYTFFRSLPETRAYGQNTTVLFWILASALRLMLYWYLRALAERLNDQILRKNFTVIIWIIAIMLALGLLVLAATGHMSQRTGTATIPRDAETVGLSDKLPGFSLYMAFYAWMGWLMWRLSRRLAIVAERYSGLSRVQLPSDSAGDMAS